MLDGANTVVVVAVVVVDIVVTIVVEVKVPCVVLIVWSR